MLDLETIATKPASSIVASTFPGSPNARPCRTSTGPATQAPRREVSELATLKFLDAKENALLIGEPVTGKGQPALAALLLGSDPPHH